MPSTSRWLVGSSMSSTSGSEAKAQAMARRLRQPPESESTAGCPSGKPPRPRACATRPGRGASSHAGVVFDGGQRGRHRLLDGETGRELRVLGDVAELNAAAKRAGTAIG